MITKQYNVDNNMYKMGNYYIYYDKIDANNLYNNYIINVNKYKYVLNHN